MAPAWKRELDTLVEDTTTFVTRIKREATMADPRMRAAVKVALAETSKSHGEKFAPMTWPTSEHDDIKQRLANFKAHQLKMQNERDEYFLQVMTRTRTLNDVQAALPCPSPGRADDPFLLHPAFSSSSKMTKKFP
jgi:hypothetical protein